MKETLQGVVNKIDINKAWLDNFNHYVPLFIEEAKTGKPWTEWNQKTFYEFFERADNQCISSLRQGYFDTVEQQNIKTKWVELAPLLQQLANNQQTPNFELYEEIRKLILTCTRNNKRAAIRRLIISLQPTLLSTILSEQFLYEGFEYIKADIQGGENLKYIPWDSKVDNWFRNSYNLLKFYQENLEGHNPMAIVTLPWQTRELFIKSTENKLAESDHKDSNDTSEDDFTTKIIKILKYKHQIILQGPPGTGKTYTAKEIAERLIGKEHIKEQCKIIQFHPAYSYEDFVRGIVANTDDGQVTYNVQNKLLANFAEMAYQNYIDSQKGAIEISKEQRLNEQFDDFIEDIILKLQEDDSPIQLTENVYIIDIEKDAIRYGGANWVQHSQGLRLKFSTIKQAYSDGNQTRQDIKRNENLNSLARHHATYTEAILNRFKQFIQENAVKYPTMINKNTEVKEKNYVLIIDEINRANLPVVLGELIYALEYRNQPVDSMYAIDENTSLTLPPNLYIIGTMNTADRSIGSIDYAIRRRFAFINILPKALGGVSFDTVLFEKVAQLFISDLTEYNEEDALSITRSVHLSEEFNPEDVWLGHSYFIINGIEERTNRLNYEIKPILKEYVKDGILKETAIAIINDL